MTWQHLARAITSLSLLFATAGCTGDDRVARCSGFEKCGGDVEATWTITNSCVEGNLTALANLNPVLPVACQSMYKSVTGSMSGSVGFASGTANVNTTMTISFEIMIDADCAQGHGVAPLDALNCSDLGPQMVPEVVQNTPHKQIACLLEGALCHCSAIDEVVTQETRTYTIANSSITYSGGSYPLDFCVKDGVMHGRQFDNMLISTIFIDATRQ